MNIEISLYVLIFSKQKVRCDNGTSKIYVHKCIGFFEYFFSDLNFFFEIKTYYETNVLFCSVFFFSSHFQFLRLSRRMVYKIKECTVSTRYVCFGLKG